MPRTSLKRKQRYAALKRLAALYSLDMRVDSEHPQYTVLAQRKKDGYCEWSYVDIDAPETVWLEIAKLLSED